jgi:hypothetical protein
MMTERNKRLIGLILLLFCSSGRLKAQSHIGKDRVDTIAGELRIVQVTEKKTEIRLKNKVVRTVRPGRIPSDNGLYEVSIYDVVRHRIRPFDEVVILNNWMQNFTGCQPGVLVLGIKKDGTYKFSKSTPECIDRKISIKKDRIEIMAKPYVHTTQYMYLPIPGGKWVYRNGVLHTIKYILLPDPRRKKKAA